MGGSERFKQLKSEVQHLADTLLPKEPRSEEGYSKEEMTRTVAFRVLVHGEFEEYLEESAAEVALAAFIAFKEKNKVSKTLVALIAFSERNDLGRPPRPPSAVATDGEATWEDKISLGKRVKAVVTDYLRVKSQNNGIKREDVARLLIPIGVDWADLDQVFIWSLDSFGVKRGKVAHTGTRSHGVTEEVNPVTELTDVNNLVSKMREVDRLFENLMAEIGK